MVRTVQNNVAVIAVGPAGLFGALNLPARERRWWSSTGKSSQRPRRIRDLPHQVLIR